jgi:hypothetical protein
MNQRLKKPQNDSGKLIYIQRNETGLMYKCKLETLIKI